jgi:hypothetical protein
LLVTAHPTLELVYTIFVNMMNTVFSALALVNLAVAAPLTARSPILSQSKGFILTAHVPEPSRDLSPSIEGFTIDPVHIGAGLNVATLSVRDDNLGYTPYCTYIPNVREASLETGHLLGTIHLQNYGNRRA